MPRLQAVAECCPLESQALVGLGLLQLPYIAIQHAVAHESQCYGHAVAVFFLIPVFQVYYGVAHGNLPAFEELSVADNVVEGHHVAHRSAYLHGYIAVARQNVRRGISPNRRTVSRAFVVKREEREIVAQSAC